MSAVIGGFLVLLAFVLLLVSSVFDDLPRLPGWTVVVLVLVTGLLALLAVSMFCVLSGIVAAL